MFEARMNDVSLLRDSISTIADMIDEAEVHITYDGIKIVSTDRTVVVVVDFFLDRKAFDEYKFESEQRVGINLLSLVQILRRAKPDDSVVLKISEKRFEIVLESSTRRAFHLSIINISKTDVPQLDKIQSGLSAFFDISSDILGSGVEDAELIGDSVILTARKDGFSMNSDSDSSATQLDVQAGDSLLIKDVNGPVRSRYSLDYMKKIIKAKKLADRASVAMATDYPLQIYFDVPDKLRLGFILAPRVDEG